MANPFEKILSLVQTTWDDWSIKVWTNDLINKENARILQRFNQTDQEEAYLYAPSVIWTFSGEFSHYSKASTQHPYKDENEPKKPKDAIPHKAIFPFRDNHWLIVVYKNGKPAYPLWQTSPKEINEAVRIGLYKPESLVGKSKYAVGGYMLQVLERGFGQGIISDKHLQKEELQKITLDRLEALEPLELLVNRYRGYLNPDQHLKIIQNECRKTSNKIYKLLEKLTEAHDYWKDYDINAHNNLMAYIKADSETIFSALVNLENIVQSDASPSKKQSALQDFLRPTGPRSVMTLIKSIRARIKAQGQSINQNITFSHKSNSWMRGDLNNSFEDMEKESNDHQADPHNPIHPLHQGRAEGSTTVRLNCSFVGRNLLAMRRMTMGVDYIEFNGSVRDYFEYVRNRETDEQKQAHELDTTAFTKWYSKESWFHFSKRVGAWVVNVITGAILFFPDIVQGIVGGLLSYDVYSYSGRVKLSVPPEFTEGTEIDKMAQALEIPGDSLGLRIGYVPAQFVRHIIVELTESMGWLLRESFITVLLQVREDYRLSWEVNQIDFQNEMNALKAEVETKQKQLDSLKRDINIKCQQEFQRDFFREEKKGEEDEKTYPLVQVPYHLSSGEFIDPLNGAVDAWKVFVELITHHVHQKNPFTGSLFNYFYTAGFFTVLFPQVAATISKPYTDLSQAIATLLSQHATSGAIGNAVSQSQIIVGIFDAAMHGRQSWLAQIVGQVEQDPIDPLIYASVAAIFGYLVTYEMNIPWVTKYLQAEMGQAQVVTMTLVGAKLGVVLAELLQVRESYDYQSREEELKAEVKRILREQYELTHPGKKITQEDESCIHETTERLCSQELLTKQQAKLRDSQEVKQFSEQFKFLKYLRDNAHLLPYFSNEQKRRTLHHAKKLFHKTPAVVVALKDQFYPKPPQSTFSKTLEIALAYIPMIFRAVVTFPIAFFGAGEWEAGRELGEKVFKDLVRIVNAVAHFIHWGTSYIFLMLKSFLFLDGIFNGIFARLEGSIRGNKHSISELTHSASAIANTYYELARQTLSQPVDWLRREVTHPDTNYTLQRTLAERLVEEVPLPEAKELDRSMSDPEPPRVYISASP